MTERWVPRSSILLGVFILMALAMVTTACGSASSSGASNTLTSGPSTSGVSRSAAAAPTTSAMVTTTIPATPRAPVTITVLYDNHATYPGTRPDWGFSCLVEGLDKTVLFDTGNNGDILLQNMRTLQIEPEDIDVVVLSHAHADHTGGLARILARNPHITVYYPASFPQGFSSAALEAGASLAPVRGPVAICDGASVTSPMGDPSEVALLVDSAQGHVLITGCAHPGIVEMVKSALGLVGEPIYAVLGGFHLMSHSAEKVNRTIQNLVQLGVQRCGPAHCTGEAATAMMKAAFADGFIEMGVGSIIIFRP